MTTRVLRVCAVLLLAAPIQVLAQMQSATPRGERTGAPVYESVDAAPQLVVPYDPAQHLTQLRPTTIVTPSMVPGDRGMYGDVNADETVNILDAQQIARHSAQLSVVDPTRMADNGDVNDDGSVDIVDAQVTARYSIGLEVSGRIGYIVTAGYWLFPFDLGRRWFYDEEWSSYVASASGATTVNATADVLLYGADMFEWEGRTGLRVFKWSWIDYDDGDRRFSFTSSMLSVVGENLDEWSTASNQWRRIIEIPPSGEWSNNAFLLAGGPNQTDQTSRLVFGNATVPYGTFNETLVASMYWSNSDPHNPPPTHIREERDEHFYDNVGVVAAAYDYYESERSGDWTEHLQGAAYLRYVDEGPFPEVFNEQQGNDGPESAITAVVPGVTIATTAIDDPGTVIVDPNVMPNSLGQNLLQDWWVLPDFPGGNILIEMNAIGSTNDLDLYLFEDTGSELVFQLASSRVGTSNEIIWGTATPGTYVIAVQAWATPELDANGDVLYFLSIIQ